jgi:hypothetical protein
VLLDCEPVVVKATVCLAYPVPEVETSVPPAPASFGATVYRAKYNVPAGVKVVPEKVWARILFSK